MSSDRLATVLRVRELIERRRLAERAVAERDAQQRRDEHRAALVARAELDLGVGAAFTADGLIHTRLGALALGDAVEQAAGQEQLAQRRVETADQALMQAAIERRSAERLRDRRAAIVARHEQRVTERRDDDVALQQWRASS